MKLHTMQPTHHPCILHTFGRQTASTYLLLLRTWSGLIGVCVGTLHPRVKGKGLEFAFTNAIH